MRRTQGCSSSWIRSRVKTQTSRVKTQTSLMNTQTSLLRKPRGNEEWRVVRMQGCSSSSRCSSMNTRARLLPLPTTYLHLSRPGPPLSHLTPTPALMHTQRHLTHTYTHTHTQHTHTPSPAPTSSPPLSTPLARRGHPAGATSPHNSTPTYISTPSEYYPPEDPEDEMAR